MTEVQHFFFIWLKEPNNEAHITELNTALAELRTIPGVKQVLFGLKADPDHVVFDEDFHYGITVTFESMDAAKVYFPHPIHQKAGEVVMKYGARFFGGYFNIAS
ncbi:Dabb family protein [Mucilaginibacter sp. SG564]|uniref:Dabb family protein n=1 Tax=Mucilaginibacter sp. SG564 TaxID=2587022 RepID=UPI001555D153|nr:Dabb family protein [Mucilaginibacter sp. SG564]NOW95031.1 hypothetical protein [Mucilaginibacter sp. SG564]